jgi:hypothetical protein
MFVPLVPEKEAGELPNISLWNTLRLLVVITTVVPPAAGPDDGLMLTMAGTCARAALGNSRYIITRQNRKALATRHAPRGGDCAPFF